MSESVEKILTAIAALSAGERSELLRRLADDTAFSPQAATPLTFSTGDLQGAPDYIIVFDGGAQGNPGPGYGSYDLTKKQDGKHDLVRLDFGRQMTNNEAEYETLVAALQGLIERIGEMGRAPGDFTVEVRGDSSLVLNQVQGVWKAKDDRMRLLRDQVRSLLSRFKAHRLVHQERSESVRVLGH